MLLGNISEIDKLKKFIDEKLLSIREVDALLALNPHKTSPLKSIGEVDSLGTIRVKRIQILGSCGELDSLGFLRNVEPFHEVQKFSLRVNINEKYELETVTKVLMTSTIILSQSKTLSIAVDEKKTLEIVMNRKTEIGG